MSKGKSEGKKTKRKSEDVESSSETKKVKHTLDKQKEQKAKKIKNEQKNQNPAEVVAEGPKADSGKRKAKKRQPKPDHVHESVGLSKAIRYLDAWANDRGNWKFEKCRQIWLLQNGFDDTKIPDAKFDDLLKYIGSIRGSMRDITLGNAKECLELDEKWQKLIEEGKTETEVVAIFQKPRPGQKKLERAKEIAEMLS